MKEESTIKESPNLFDEIRLEMESLLDSGQVVPFRRRKGAKLKAYPPPPLEGFTEKGLPAKIEYLIAYLRNRPIRYLQEKLELGSLDISLITGTSYTDRFNTPWTRDKDNIAWDAKLFSSKACIRALIFAQVANERGILKAHESGRVLPIMNWAFDVEGWETPTETFLKEKVKNLEALIKKQRVEFEAEIETLRNLNISLQVKLKKVESSQP